MNNKSIAQEQGDLISAIEGIHAARVLCEDYEEQITITHNYLAFNNSPGLNVFLKNIRLELGYNQNRIKFGIPHDKDKYNDFIHFLVNTLSIFDFDVKEREGIKYLFVIELDQLMYTTKGIEQVVSLINKILDLS